MTDRRRVVITGMGVTSALGDTPGALYDALRAGRSAVRAMPEWSGEFAGIPLAAPVAVDEERVRAIPRKFRRAMGDAAVYAALAALEARAMAGLDDALLASGRVGCAVSSTMGSSRSIIEATEILLAGRREEMPAMQFFKCVSHSSALNVGNLLGLTGVMLSPCSACASGAQAIGAAYEQIRMGRQEVMFAGGSDEVTAAAAGSFALLSALAEGGGAFAPEAASRPFDARRSGLVCGAGAGIVVLEEYEHARRRGAEPLAEIIGYATNANGVHVSQSDARSIERCIRLALADAGIAPAAVDYISAHATATLAGDCEEAAALRTVFGGGVPVAGMKGHLGHTLGASGALELAALCEMFRHGELLPTLNLEEPAADCAGLDHVTRLRPGRVGIALKTAIAFGGVNAVLAVKNLR